MAHTLIPFGVQINLQGAYPDGQELMHVFGAQVTHAPITHADCENIGNVVSSWAAASLVTLLNPLIVITQLTVTARDLVNGAQDSRALGVIGTDSPGNILPPSTTLALKKVTGVRGRRNRGRFFVWPANQSHQDSTHPSLFKPAYVAQAISVYLNLMSDLDTAGTPLSILSETDAAAKPVLNIVAVDYAMDSQRRRDLGRGR